MKFLLNYCVFDKTVLLIPWSMKQCWHECLYCVVPFSHINIMFVSMFHTVPWTQVNINPNLHIYSCYPCWLCECELIFKDKLIAFCMFLHINLNFCGNKRWQNCGFEKSLQVMSILFEEPYNGHKFRLLRNAVFFFFFVGYIWLGILQWHFIYRNRIWIDLCCDLWFICAVTFHFTGHFWLFDENLRFSDTRILEGDKVLQISIPRVYRSVGQANCKGFDPWGRKGGGLKLKF